MECVDLKRFMFEQKVKQSDLAKYLGVSEGYISQVASGKKQLSDENFSKVLNNPFGWDTSMLTENQSKDTVREEPEETVSIAKLFALIEDQRVEINTLLTMLREKDATIEELRRELDARKGGSANDVAHSSSADAV